MDSSGCDGAGSSGSGEHPASLASKCVMWAM